MPLTSLTHNVPASVLCRVAVALKTLRDAHRVLTDVYTVLGVHRLALELDAVVANTASARAMLATFRDLAADHGVDAQWVIDDVGGEPNFSEFFRLSENACRPMCAGRR